MKTLKLPALLLTALFSTCTLGEGMPEFPFIIVAGSAGTDVPPDKATVYFSLETFDASSEVAQATMDTAQRATIDVLAAFEIPEDNIVADPADKAIVRRRNADGTEDAILGYRFNQGFRVELTALDRFADFVNALLALDNLSYGSQTFSISNSDEVMAQLLDDAARDATERAENLAESLDVRIRNVHAINESGTGFGSFQASFGLSGEGRAQYAAAGVAATASLLVPKTIRLGRRIDVVYRITP
jgi:uncharacterized protein YggE